MCILDIFKKALLEVQASYFRYQRPNGELTYGERVFAYELYHQLRIRYNGPGLINAEFVKSMQHVIPYLNIQYVPDIVVHDPDNLEGNLLACEIKANPEVTLDALLNDLNKIEFYTRPNNFVQPGLGFQYGILLVVNGEFPCIWQLGSPETRNEFMRMSSLCPQVHVWNVVGVVNEWDMWPPAERARRLNIYGPNQLPGLL